MIRFSKWEGTGNDFILVDDRDGNFPATDEALVRRLCDRHFGIGSDGLILLQLSKEAGYHMDFFNPDGSRSFCGNGSRCAFAFWSWLTGSGTAATFTAIDGMHTAEWRGQEVAITLLPVKEVLHEKDGVDFLHNGSPHEIVRVDDPQVIDLGTVGRARRHSGLRGPGGTNVNFIRVASNGSIRVRTYERGVEAETLSCGTGVTAAALSALSRGEVHSPVPVISMAGTLHVEAERLADGGWGNIRLIGPVRRVFDGSWDPSSQAAG